MALPPRFTALLARPPAEVRIALVGASDDPSKYGCIILRDLERKGYQVVPVNSRRKTIAGRAAYAAVSEVSGQIDLVDFVIPPWDSLAVVEALGVSTQLALWFQPGSYDRRVVEAARARTPDVVAGPCIMVET